MKQKRGEKQKKEWGVREKERKKTQLDRGKCFFFFFFRKRRRVQQTRELLPQMAVEAQTQ